ncbi:MAG: 23S rRNA (adenine(2503)-C(2))-methyltransferase RlmN [Clostridia bacterium]|nr:23S rRNA (adenine(2503)-C(2))-methyltransferase RlmN [Clostridia bacterium]
MTDVLALTAEELREYIINLGGQRYRADQLINGLKRGKRPRDVDVLPKELREKLDADVPFCDIEKVFVSTDGTMKFLFRLFDGNLIESVLMRYEHGNTVCLSTECGCAMGCRFCATGTLGLIRRLTVTEIFTQASVIAAYSGERISNVVLMGMGEPLDNYDNTVKFIRFAASENGLGIGMRHISLSTCGLVDGIKRLAGEDLQITLSLSLHAADDETRSAMMPINKKWGVAETLKACREYYGVSKRRIAFEYALVKDKNDSPAYADRLASALHKYCPDMPLYVNLIPVNPVEGSGCRSVDRAAVAAFSERLERRGVTCTVRRRLGNDISASCGQLAAKNR